MTTTPTYYVLWRPSPTSRRYSTYVSAARDAPVAFTLDGVSNFNLSPGRIINTVEQFRELARHDARTISLEAFALNTDLAEEVLGW